MRYEFTYLYAYAYIHYEYMHRGEKTHNNASSSQNKQQIDTIDTAIASVLEHLFAPLSYCYNEW
jgi:hypothetical protein